MTFPSIGNTSVVNVVGQCTSQDRIYATDNIGNTTYRLSADTKDISQ